MNSDSNNGAYYQIVNGEKLPIDVYANISQALSIIKADLDFFAMDRLLQNTEDFKQLIKKPNHIKTVDKLISYIEVLNQDLIHQGLSLDDQHISQVAHAILHPDEKDIIAKEEPKKIKKIIMALMRHYCVSSLNLNLGKGLFK